MNGSKNKGLMLRNEFPLRVDIAPEQLVAEIKHVQLVTTLKA